MALTWEEISADPRFIALSDNEKTAVIADIESKHGPIARPEPTPEPEEPGFIDSALKATDEMQGTLYGAAGLVGSAVGSDKLKDWGVEGYKRNMDEAAEYGEGTSFKDVTKDPTKVGKWAIQTAGSLIPSMAEAAAGAMLGSMVAPGAGTAIGGLASKTLLKKSIKKILKEKGQDLIKEVGEEKAKQQIAKEVLKSFSAKVGAGIAVGASESGGNWAELLTEHGVDNPASALAWGTAAAGMEFLGGNMKLIDEFFGADIVKPLKKAISKGDGYAVARMAKHMVKNAPAEMAQEAGQELMSMMNIIANTEETFESLGGKDRLIEAAAAGAIGGMMGGAVQGAIAKPDTDTDVDPVKTINDFSAFENSEQTEAKNAEDVADTEIQFENSSTFNVGAMKDASLEVKDKLQTENDRVSTVRDQMNQQKQAEAEEAAIQEEDILKREAATKQAAMEQQAAAERQKHQDFMQTIESDEGALHLTGNVVKNATAKKLKLDSTKHFQKAHKILSIEDDNPSIQKFKDIRYELDRITQTTENNIEGALAGKLSSMVTERITQATQLQAYQEEQKLKGKDTAQAKRYSTQATLNEVGKSDPFTDITTPTTADQEILHNQVIKNEQAPLKPNKPLLEKLRKKELSDKKAKTTKVQSSTGNIYTSIQNKRNTELSESSQKRATTKRTLASYKAERDIRNRELKAKLLEKEKEQKRAKTAKAEEATKEKAAKQRAQARLPKKGKALKPKKSKAQLPRTPVDKKKSRSQYDYGNTQVNLSKSESKAIKQYTSKIPSNKIYTEKGDSTFGREDSPHVTIRYGLDTVNPKDVAPAFKDLGAINAKMGKVSMFEHDNYDVLKVDIESTELHAANKEVGKAVKVPGETFKDYKPHVTLAYVKKGEGKEYVGDTTFEGKEISFDKITFNAKDGKVHEYALKGHEDIAYSREPESSTKPKSPEHHTKIETAINMMRPFLNSITKVVVLKNPSETAGKIGKKVAKDKAYDASGLFHRPTNTIYLFTDNLVNDRHAKITVWHELGHFSFRELLGKKVTSVLETVYKKYEDQIQQAIKHHQYKNNKSTQLAIAEEFVIDEFLKNTGKRASYLDHLKNLMMKLARKLGMGKAITDSELRVLLTRMRDNLTNRTPGNKKVRTKGKDIAYSRGDSFQETLNRDYSGTLGKLDPAQMTTKETFLKSEMSLWDRAVYKMVDQLNPLNVLERGVKVSQDMSGYVAKRLLTSFPTIYKQFLEHGMPQFDKATNWIKITKDKTGGLHTAIRKLGDEDNVKAFFTRYQAKSAQEIIDSDRELDGSLYGVEGVSDADMIRDAFKATETAYTENKDTWDTVEKDLKRINKSMLDFAQEAGIINEEARKKWERAYYSPFNRISEEFETGEIETLFQNPGGKNIKDVIKKLKGGHSVVADPLNNLINAYSLIMHESLRNLANKKCLNVMVATDQAVALPHWSKKPGDGVIKIFNKGNAAHYRIHDPVLFSCLADVSEQGKIPDVLKLPKKWLTYSVTFAPAFRVANFLRDTVHTSFMNASFIPVLDSYRGLMHSWRNSKEFVEFSSTGGAFSGDYYQRDAGIKNTVDNMMVEVMGKGTKKGRTPLDKVTNAWHSIPLVKFWEKVGTASENAARMGMYLKDKKAGKSDVEAGFNAKDLLDFHMSGKATLMKWATQLVPFLNARAVGLHKLGRAAAQDGNKANFLLKGSMLTMAAILLHGLNEDDERYKELKDYEKYTYFNFFDVPGMGHVRIPMPFEIGAIFGSVIPTMWNQPDDALNATKFHLAHTFNVSYTDIQVLRPFLNQYANKDAFTEIPIVSRREEGLDPDQQFGRNTSLTARAIGKWTGQSPKRIDQANKDINGYIGTSMVTMLDWAYGHMYGDERPEGTMSKKWMDVVGVRRFVRGKETDIPKYTKTAEKFYELAQEYDRTYNTFRNYAKLDNKDVAREYRKANKDTLRKRKILSKYQQVLSKINTRINIVHMSEKLSPQQKRAEIDKLLLKRQEFFKRALARTNKAPERIDG